MSKDNFNINNLRIASPCHVGWENMSGDEKARFCSSCNLNVYNFSEMSKKEVSDLILETEGRICGRLYKRADGTVITRDCPTGLRALRKKISRTLSLAFGTVIALCTISFGQTEKEKSCKIISQGKVTRYEYFAENALVEGNVTDLQGGVIPGVKVLLHNIETGKEVSTITSEQGEFKIKNIPFGTYSAKFETNGFKTYKIEKVEINKNENLKFEISLQLSAEVVLVGIVASEPLIDTQSSEIKTVITRRMLDSLPFEKD